MFFSNFLSNFVLILCVQHFVGVCPPEYAYTQVFEFCLSFKGLFTDDVGEAKCQEDNAKYMLIQSEEENRFASLLACKAFVLYI